MKKKYLYVTCSTSFFFRTRCKYCKSGPDYYFPDGSFKSSSPEEMLEELDSVRRKHKTAFYERQRIRLNGFALSEHSFVPSHAKMAMNGYTQKSNSDAHVFICTCGSSSWIYSENKGLIASMRKSLVLYPQGYDIDWGL